MEINLINLLKKKRKRPQVWVNIPLWMKTLEWWVPVVIIRLETELGLVFRAQPYSRIQRDPDARVWPQMRGAQTGFWTAWRGLGLCEGLRGGRLTSRGENVQRCLEVDRARDTWTRLNSN